MKKILLSIAVFLSLSAYADEPKSEAPLILEYNYVDKGKQKSLIHLENDTEFCCYFDVVNTHNADIKEDVIKVIDRKSGVCLGVIFGYPNKDFIMEIYVKRLAPENIQDIVSKMGDYTRN